MADGWLIEHYGSSALPDEIVSSIGFTATSP
jgi:hypothetical protein